MKTRLSSCRHYMCHHTDRSDYSSKPTVNHIHTHCSYIKSLFPYIGIDIYHSIYYSKEVISILTNKPLDATPNSLQFERNNINLVITRSICISYRDNKYRPASLYVRRHSTTTLQRRAYRIRISNPSTCWTDRSYVEHISWHFSNSYTWRS
jgi:hypothetical protein